MFARQSTNSSSRIVKTHSTTVVIGSLAFGNLVLLHDGPNLFLGETVLSGNVATNSVRSRVLLIALGFGALAPAKVFLYEQDGQDGHQDETKRSSAEVHKQDDSLVRAAFLKGSQRYIWLSVESHIARNDPVAITRELLWALHSLLLTLVKITLNRIVRFHLAVLKTRCIQNCHIVRAAVPLPVVLRLRIQNLTLFLFDVVLHRMPVPKCDDYDDDDQHNADSNKIPPLLERPPSPRPQPPHPQAPTRSTPVLSSSSAAPTLTSVLFSSRPESTQLLP
mmetsp:Transcript_12300/g.37523  ORF Transcript_12300/g.37523 Transcript_12300/m.37523 type:complete len:278 (+) Transcript_12300:369-1202(+)